MRHHLTLKSVSKIVATLALFAIADADLISADELNHETTSTEQAVSSTNVQKTAVTEIPVKEAVPFVAEADASEVVAEENVDATVEKPASEKESTIPTADSAQIAASTKETVEATAEQSSSIKVAHTNDMHGRLQQEDGVTGIANAAGYFEEIDADVVVDSGDAFQGLPLSNHDSGQAMAEAMTAADYDAMTVGNHEFDFGFETATAYEDITGFPVVSSNIVKDGEQVFQPSTNITTESGHNLGVVGATTPETATKTHPKNVEGITFEDPSTAVTRELQKLVTDTTIDEDAFIVLAHLGVDPVTNIEWQGSYLAEHLDQQAFLDGYQVLVIDGHSHTAFPEGQTFGNILYAQTGTALNNIGVIEFDPSQPGQATATLVTAADVNASVAESTDPAVSEKVSAIQAIVDDADAVYAEETSAVVVENNPVWLNGVREYVRSHETNMGNLITDVMVDYGRDGGFNNSTDFAMINGGGIREQIQADQPITEGDVIAVLPFGNIISQIEVTGNQIYDMFELAYSAPTVTESYQSSNGLYEVSAIDPDSGLVSLSAAGGFLQVSDDIKVYFDPTIEAGNRVLSVYLKDQASGKFYLVPEADDSVYYMATNDFLAQGGDGYTMLSGAREEGPSLDQVVIDAIRDQGADLLLQYADALPQERILPILTADYANLVDSDIEDGTPPVAIDNGSEDHQNNGNTELGNNNHQSTDGVESSKENPTLEKADQQNKNNDSAVPVVTTNENDDDNHHSEGSSISDGRANDTQTIEVSDSPVEVALPNAGFEKNDLSVLGLGIIALGSVLVVSQHKKHEKVSY